MKMKKMLIAVFALCLGFSAMADDYNVVDFGLWFGFPSSMKQANVRGLRIGFPVSYGDGYVDGLEAALLCAETSKITGLQAAIGWCQADDLSGLQASVCLNLCNGESKGLQLSLVNLCDKSGWQIGLVNSGNNAKFQFGLINLNKGGLWSVFPFINFGKDTFKSADTIRAEGEAEAAAKAKAAKAKK